MEKDFLTVSALTKYIKLKFDKDRYLRDVPLKAEVAEINVRRGNYYLRLKDEHALLSAVIFAEYETEIVKSLEAGSEVVVLGDISVYEKTGRYQMYIHEVELFGQGHLYLAFEKLKQKLFAAGYFDLKHKKAMPTMPGHIVLITAPNSAALHDMVVTVQQRYPLAKLTILPSAVQGAKAVPELIEQLKKADTLSADIVVLARGGGSYEDLQAFNDEKVVLTIFDLKTPIVTGIGHEVDVTIADLVADLRAATPSAAIERITPDKAELHGVLQAYTERLKRSFETMLRTQTGTLAIQTSRLRMPYLSFKMIEEREQLVQAKQKALHDVMLQNMVSAKRALQEKAAHLEALSPFAVLARGYSITEQLDKVITSTKQINRAERVHITLMDGTLICNVEEIKNDEKKAII